VPASGYNTCLVQGLSPSEEIFLCSTPPFCSQSAYIHLDTWHVNFSLTPTLQTRKRTKRSK